MKDKLIPILPDCRVCEYNLICKFKPGSLECRKSYEGFGNGRRLSKRETGRARG